MGSDDGGSVIVIDPDAMNGTPCFGGARVPFENLMAIRI